MKIKQEQMSDEELIETMYKVPREKWHMSRYSCGGLVAVESFQIRKPCIRDGIELIDTKDRFYYNIDKIGQKICGIQLNNKYLFQLRHSEYLGSFISLGKYEITKSNNRFSYADELYKICMKRFPEEERLRKEKERLQEEKENRKVENKIKFARGLLSKLK